MFSPTRTPRSTKIATTPKTPCSDRFIPNRSLLDVDWSEYMLKDSPTLPTKRTGMASMDCSSSMEEYTSSLIDTLYPDHHNGKVFSYGSRPLTSKNKALFTDRELGTPTMKKSKKKMRKISQFPEKVLDAPDFIDDYYLNLLDWSSDNVLAVALNKVVYLWNAENGEISELLTLEEDDYVCSLKWAESGKYIAVGTFKGGVRIYDGHMQKLIRTMNAHSSRVSSLAWNGQLLSSGSRDSSIINFDVGNAEPVVSLFQGHEQEVCGLKWNQEGTQLASGGNDNLLLVWENQSNSDRPRFTFDAHVGAVKAIEWCPHQSNLLVSGGGSADRHIRFWNTSTGACLGQHDTQSQVCSILWSKTHKNELISSHGFSNNQLTVWDYPHMTKITELSGHTQRVLQMAMSPDGETVVSVAADETLRFWRVFENNKRSTKNSNSRKRRNPSRQLKNCMIR